MNNQQLIPAHVGYSGTSEFEIPQMVTVAKAMELRELMIYGLPHPDAGIELIDHEFIYECHPDDGDVICVGVRPKTEESEDDLPF